MRSSMCKRKQTHPNHYCFLFADVDREIGSDGENKSGDNDDEVADDDDDGDDVDDGDDEEGRRRRRRRRKKEEKSLH